jgi:hypothetical protein
MTGEWKGNTAHYKDILNTKLSNEKHFYVMNTNCLLWWNSFN